MCLLQLEKSVAPSAMKMSNAAATTRELPGHRGSGDSLGTQCWPLLLTFGHSSGSHSQAGLGEWSPMLLSPCVISTVHVSLAMTGGWENRLTCVHRGGQPIRVR